MQYSIGLDGSLSEMVSCTYTTQMTIYMVMGVESYVNSTSCDAASGNLASKNQGLRLVLDRVMRSGDTV